MVRLCLACTKSYTPTQQTKPRNWCSLVSNSCHIRSRTAKELSRQLLSLTVTIDREGLRGDPRLMSLSIAASCTEVKDQSRTLRLRTLQVRAPALPQDQSSVPSTPIRRLTTLFLPVPGTGHPLLVSRGTCGCVFLKSVKVTCIVI